MNNPTSLDKKKMTLKEKKAYAKGYSQAYEDCYESVFCLKDKVMLSTFIGFKALYQLLNPKKI